MIHVEHSSDFDFLRPSSHFIKVKDFAVTGDDFDLFYNADQSVLMTFPQPDEQEIGKYYESENYISHTDGKKNWFEKAYQLVKYFSLKRKLNLINQLHPTKGTLLDVGTGTGDFLTAAKKNGWKIFGIEPNTKARDLATRKGMEVLSGLENLGENQFDVITLWHVLEHLPDVESQLNKFHKLLKSDGLLVVAVPNFNCYSAKHYDSFWAAYDVPRHFWHFSQGGMKTILSKNQFRLVETLPMAWDAYYVNLLSEKYKHGKMKVFSAFFHAVKCNFSAKRTGEYASLIYCVHKTQNQTL